MAGMSTKRQDLIDRVASLPEELLDEVGESLDAIEHERAGGGSAAARRHRAWQRIEEITSRVVDTRPDPHKSNQEEEEEIAEMVKEFRRSNERHG